MEYFFKVLFTIKCCKSSICRMSFQNIIHQCAFQNMGNLPMNKYQGMFWFIPVTSIVILLRLGRYSLLIMYLKFLENLKQPLFSKSTPTIGLVYLCDQNQLKIRSHSNINVAFKKYITHPFGKGQVTKQTNNDVGKWLA